ncbi:MAG TPA: helix-turn-helix transcriptional regulator [Sulfuricurvum sp.]|nr:helix-turn-helix transcriptional regulator [Sulfuricurvum sp.]
MAEVNILCIFGEKLKDLRSSKNISQEELAFLADLDRTYISGIERGKRNVSLINICKIAKALQINVAELMVCTNDSSI